MAGGLLGQLLEDPQLAPALRALPAPALRQVILRVGLEDAGELIALSTLDQLREVFDEDLWRSPRPGQDEVFDAARAEGSLRRAMMRQFVANRARR